MCSDMSSPQPAVPSGISSCSGVVCLPWTVVPILLGRRASPLILVSPVLFLTLFVSFSFCLTFYALSRIHFHRGAISLAAGVSCVLTSVCSAALSSWLCPAWGSPRPLPAGATPAASLCPATKPCRPYTA